jgi:hypothetical protein
MTLEAHMKHLLLIACAMALVVAAHAADEKKAAPEASAANVEYKPPARGAPKARVGGSTRGMTSALTMTVIAPDHTGLAASEQPELFWYISQRVQQPVEFMVVPVDASDPLIQTTIPVHDAGIQRINLADYKVKLKPDVEYQWLITYAAKPGSRAKDAITGGRLMVARPTGKLVTYTDYAAAGYWYDAFARLRGEMARHPGDPMLAAAQQSLLDQAGLAEVARRVSQQ